MHTRHLQSTQRWTMIGLIVAAVILLVIAARERLLAMVRDGLTQQPFVQWTAADQSAAHTVCRQFELVDQLIEGRLFDPDLFLRSWHHNIVRCWQACEQMVIYRRGQLEEPGFGRHFEELHVLARGCTTQVRPRLVYGPQSPGQGACRDAGGPSSRSRTARSG